MIHRLTDKHTIRQRLNRDREWALYALADLDDGLFELSEWWASGDGLALVFHGIAIRPIFVMGDAAETRALLSALPVESGYLNLQRHALAAADGIYAYRQGHDMCRMMLGQFVPHPGETQALTPADCDELLALFASGEGSGIAFAPAQLDTGFFRGVREGGALVAVAGVHVASLVEGVAGVGNVFVREDRRGRGLAQMVLSATVAALRDRGVRTIGLNVAHTNAAAIHAYENLGFRTAFRYIEGTADRVAPAEPPAPADDRHRHLCEMSGRVSIRPGVAHRHGAPVVEDSMTKQHYIGNAWQQGSAGATLPVVDPSTGDAFGDIARGTEADVSRAVAAARAAIGATFDGPWGRLSAAQRGRLMARMAAVIAERGEELARLEARDTGKSLKTARVDAAALARYFEYYGGACDKLHGETLPYEPGYTVMTIREPHGVTGHIVPWNYPMQIFGRTVGASLAAGNACVVKPAEDASLSILRLAELAAEVGFPAGTLNVVTGLGHEAGAALTAHPGIDHLSFTGSTTTGRLVAEAAAKRHCPVTLELGGKSPQLVFDDADLDAALPVIVNAIVQNAGQTCSAGSRLLVQRTIYEGVLERLAASFRTLRAGPPHLELEMGPLVNRKQYDQVKRFLSEAEHEGIRVMARGTLHPDASSAGYYHEAVLLRDVPHESAVAQREIFGPVLAAMPFDDEAEAVRLANGTDYGLVAGVWTRDGARQLRVARRLRCGQVFVNNYGAGGGVELPFGGVKSSGYGREKGFEALLGFTVLKTIAIRHG